MNGFEKIDIFGAQAEAVSDEESREELIDDYDESHKELKADLASLPATYEKLRNEGVSSKILSKKQEEGHEKELAKKEASFNQEMEEFNLEMERAVKEKREAMIDKVTGLEQRPGLYKLMNSSMEKYFDEEELGDSQKFIDAIMKDDRDFRDANLTIAFGDVSFLSLANKAGHDVGDGLLTDIASKVKNEGSKAFRHGGDELTIFYNEELEKVLESVEKIKKEVGGLEEAANLKKQYDLEPNVDIGLAHFHEAVEVFKELLNNLSKTEDGKKILESMDSVKELQDIWVKIADQRAFLKKGETRIPLLIKIKKEDPENYKEVIGSLRKGGYDATDTELDYLGEVKEEDQENVIKMFIVQKEKKILAGKDDFYDHVRSEAILKKAMESN